MMEFTGPDCHISQQLKVEDIIDTSGKQLAVAPVPRLKRTHGDKFSSVRPSLTRTSLVSRFRSTGFGISRTAMTQTCRLANMGRRQGIG